MRNDLYDMQAEVAQVNFDKGWRGDGAPDVSFGESIALLHSEVSEALEAYRDHGLADATGDSGKFVRFGGDTLSTSPVHFVPPKPEGVGSELADVLIRLLDTADRFGIDLTAEYERKVAFNATRPYRHGGKRL